MHKTLIAVCAVLLLLGAVGGVHTRNQVIELDVAAQTQWKQVENQLERQHDLLPKLVKVASRYAAHEKEILEGVMASRERYLGASSAERPSGAKAVDAGLVRLLALAERYPELRADRHFRDLSHEIAGTQNRITVERARYNEIVGLLNQRLRQLPWRLAAFEVLTRDYYEVSEEKLDDFELEI